MITSRTEFPRTVFCLPQNTILKWAYDDEAVDVVRRFTALKAELMPYLYRNSIYTSKTGVPMMRSMVMEFTEDLNCAYLDKQYMFGDSLLVAPIFNDENKAIYYLPEGTWTHYLTGEKKQGGKWYKEDCDYLTIPVFVKENSLIATGAVNSKPDYDYAQDVTVTAYELKDGKEAETTVYSMDQKAETKVSVLKNGNTINVKAEAEKPCTIVLKDEAVKSVSGAEFVMDGNDCKVKLEKGGEFICIL